MLLVPVWLEVIASLPAVNRIFRVFLPEITFTAKRQYAVSPDPRPARCRCWLAVSCRVIPAHAVSSPIQFGTESNSMWRGAVVWLTNPGDWISASGAVPTAACPKPLVAIAVHLMRLQQLDQVLHRRRAAAETVDHAGRWSGSDHIEG